MHLLITQVHFLFWQLDRGQYVTRIVRENYIIISLSGRMPHDIRIEWSKVRSKVIIKVFLLRYREITCVIFVYYFDSPHISLFSPSLYLRASMNERNTLLCQNYLSFYSRKGSTVVSWEIDGETYSERGFLLPYLLPGSRGCKRWHPLASSSETT